MLWVRKSERRGVAEQVFYEKILSEVNMEHYSIKNHVKSSHKEKIIEFLLAFLSQYLMLFISIKLHRAFKDKGVVIQPVVQGIEGASSPTLGRLIYMISAIVLGIPGS